MARKMIAAPVFALLLGLAPTGWSAALAQSDCEHETRVTCAEGSSWDAETQKCTPIVSS